MSWVVNLSKGRLEGQDWSSLDFETPESLADLSYWHLPLKVFFDDPNDARRYFKQLWEEHAQPSKEAWVVHHLTTGRTLIHPTWKLLDPWLTYLTDEEDGVER